MSGPSTCVLCKARPSVAHQITDPEDHLQPWAVTCPCGVRVRGKDRDAAVRAWNHLHCGDLIGGGAGGMALKAGDVVSVRRAGKIVSVKLLERIPRGWAWVAMQSDQDGVTVDISPIRDDEILMEEKGATA